jgi:hypothetical protein
LTVAALPLLALLAADACRSGEATAPGDIVTAESQFGNGSVSGPVRAGRNGLEVRLPGGTWVECANSCRETLRLETVDFWQAQNKTTNRCGLLGCLELRYPRP